MDYMLPHKAAERLQVSRTTIWRWIREGRFEGVRRKGFGETSPQMIPVESVEKVALDLQLPPDDNEGTCNGSA